LPSNSFHILCERLADINNRISLALDNADTAALLELTEEHKCVMKDLIKQGQCRDIGMLGLIEELRDRILGLGRTIQEQRDKLRKQLLMAGRKKQAAAVYTHDDRGLYSKMRSSNMNREFTAGNVNI
jgi:hypothetical protein